MCLVPYQALPPSVMLFTSPRLASKSVKRRLVRPFESNPTFDHTFPGLMHGGPAPSVWLPDSEAALSHHVTSLVNLLVLMLLDFTSTSKATKVKSASTFSPKHRFSPQSSFVGAARMMNKMRSPATAVAAAAIR
jgi:hypothetical protein